MQKNPINEGDSIQEPMTLQAYEDAVSLPDGIYPITDDAGTVLDASVIAYGSDTVENTLSLLDEHRIISAGTTSLTVTNGQYTLPNTVLNGYSGNYICISGVAGATSCVAYNSLSGASATQKSAGDYTATYQFSGSYTIGYTIIKV